MLAAALYVFQPLSGTEASQPGQINAAAAVTVLMAVWWLTEAIPLAATALLPLALFPLLEVMDARSVSTIYGNDMVFLFLGGFLVALAIEESGLHRRIALRIVAAMGDNPRRIVLGFMIAAGALSMWLSNTATTMMLLPIALSVITHAGRDEQAVSRNFGVALLLGVAYAASMGGLGTIIGTPTNILFRGYFNDTYPEAPEITFPGWMLMATPLSVVFILSGWLLLVRRVFPLSAEPMLGGKSVIAEQLAALGPTRRNEWAALAVFLTTALLWIGRKPVEGVGWAVWLGLEDYVRDSTVAIFMAVLCFLLPVGDERGKPLLTWENTARIPWGILLLIGGGMALAAGMTESGLSQYLGTHLAEAATDLPLTGMAAAVSTGMTFLTELTSNLASLNMILPVLADAAEQLGVDPRLLMIPATVSASCAFMLPVATPPNAIVYGSGRIQIRDMIKAGIYLNLLGIVLAVAAVLLIGIPALGISLDGSPSWASGG